MESGGDVLGVVVGGTFALIGLLLVFKRHAAARLIVRYYSWHSNRYPWLYPGPLRRWSTSERLMSFMVVPVGVVWTIGGMWFVILGLGLR